MENTQDDHIIVEYYHNYFKRVFHKCAKLELSKKKKKKKKKKKDKRNVLENRDANQNLESWWNSFFPLFTFALVRNFYIKGMNVENQ